LHGEVGPPGLAEDLHRGFDEAGSTRRRFGFVSFVVCGHDASPPSRAIAR
jgi:hypothetical protein